MRGAPVAAQAVEEEAAAAEALLRSAAESAPVPVPWGHSRRLRSR
jgi:hypothetical protein